MLKGKTPKNFTFNVNKADVNIQESEDGKVYIDVENPCEDNNELKTCEKDGIFSANLKVKEKVTVTLKLPKMDSITIYVEEGSLGLINALTDNLDVRIDSGNIELINTTAVKEIKATVLNGDIYLKKVHLSSGKIVTHKGDILIRKIGACEYQNVLLEADEGKIDVDEY